MLYKYLPESRLDVLEDILIRFTQVYALNDPFENSLKIGSSEYEVDPSIKGNTTKFASFSRNNQNLLMWSHYANSHRGICVGFDRHNDYFGRAIAIKYRRHRTSLNGINLSDFGSTEDITKQICLEKSIDWAYEEEERLFLSDVKQCTLSQGLDDNGHEIILNTYPRDAIKSVFVGMNAQKETLINVHHIVSKLNQEIDIYFAKKNNQEFKIDFMKIDKNLDKVLGWIENKFS